MSKNQQSITSLPLSPDEERRGRIRAYLIAMSVRVVCIVLAFVLTGWPQIVAIIGAVALPYFAVMIANVKSKQTGAEVLRPGAVVPLARPRDPEDGRP